MSSWSLPRIKYLLRHLSLDGARACLEDLLLLPDEKAVRARAAQELEARGLGHLIAADASGVGQQLAGSPSERPADARDAVASAGGQ